MKIISQYALITTKHRGVFFGELVAYNRTEAYAILRDARCAIRFGTKGGFLELAQTGPTGRSKIGATAPEIELLDVTSKTVCSNEAVAKWQAA